MKTCPWTPQSPLLSVPISQTRTYPKASSALQGGMGVSPVFPLPPLPSPPLAILAAAAAPDKICFVLSRPVKNLKNFGHPPLGSPGLSEDVLLFCLSRRVDGPLFPPVKGPPGRPWSPPPELLGRHKNYPGPPQRQGTDSVSQHYEPFGQNESGKAPRKPRFLFLSDDPKSCGASGRSKKVYSPFPRPQRKSKTSPGPKARYSACPSNEAGPPAKAPPGAPPRKKSLGAGLFSLPNVRAHHTTARAPWVPTPPPPSLA